MMATDMRGRRCGKLTVEARHGSKNGKAMWACRCDCGGRVIASGDNLRQGKVTTCGCSGAQIDVGDRFGKLTVVADAGRSRKGERIWECRCDCGGTAKVRAARLTNGGTTTCGCGKNHRGGAWKTKSTTSSRFKGVGWLPEKRKWYARIKRKWLGFFEYEESAAMAYDEAALKVFGEHAMTNARMGLYRNQNMTGKKRSPIDELPTEREREAARKTVAILDPLPQHDRRVLLEWLRTYDPDTALAKSR